MNYVLDNSGNFNAIKYLGNLSFSPTLIIEPLSYYEIQFKFNIENDDNNDYERESYVSSVYMNLTSNNLDFKTSNGTRIVGNQLGKLKDKITNFSCSKIIEI